jgi:hypothetical protein
MDELTKRHGVTLAAFSLGGFNRKTGAMMTDDPSARPGAEGERRRSFDRGAILDVLLDGFRDMSVCLEVGKPPGPSDVARAGMSLGTVRRKILEEVRRHDAGFLNSEEPGATEPIDLAEMRDRIGRRLDRIRAARGSG